MKAFGAADECWVKSREGDTARGTTGTCRRGIGEDK